MSEMKNDTLDQVLSTFPDTIRAILKERIEKIVSYTPKVGIMGKSGAGKSSLANAIVGRSVFKTGNAGGCTRDFQEESVQIGNRQIIFMDLPGIAESKKYQEEYTKLYQEKIKELDIILWAIKVDDRANVDDETFYDWLIQHYKKEQVLFVLTQSDKAAPTREWNYAQFEPSIKQRTVIGENQQRIATDFNVPLDDVIPVACEYLEDESRFDRYNFDALMTRIIYRVPSQAKSSIYASADKETLTEEAKQEAQSGFGGLVSDVIDVVIDNATLPAPVKILVKETKKLVVGGVKKLWNKFFG